MQGEYKANITLCQVAVSVKRNPAQGIQAQTTQKAARQITHSRTVMKCEANNGRINEIICEEATDFLWKQFQKESLNLPRPEHMQIAVLHAQALGRRGSEYLSKDRAKA
jgi:hypothetical protein